MQIFDKRPCAYKKNNFLKEIANDPSILPDYENKGSLSPKSKLKLLKNKIESRIKFAKASKTDEKDVEFMGTYHGLTIED